MGLFRKPKTMVKEYNTAKQYSKDMKRMEKQGWEVLNVTNKTDTSLGFFFGLKHDKLVVTYKRR